MKIFMTGATGFIGAHLARRLVADGHAVVALVRNPQKAAELPAEVERFAGDLGTFDDAGCVLPACDLVIHLAGVVTARDPADYERVNFGAVKSLVACLERQSFRPRRLLFASSLAAVGPSQRGRRRSEQDAATPIDPYGRAKLAAEQFLTGVSIPTTAFRPPIVFGRRDTATLSFFKMAAKGFGFRVAGEPQELSFIDVDDLVSAIVAMAGDGSSEHRTYFASAGEDTDSKQLWAALATAMDRRVRVIAVPKSALRSASVVSTGLSKLFGYLNQLDKKQYDQLTAPAFTCSSAALQRAHGWAPRTSLVEALQKAYAGYREDGWLR
jgi:nucleoside-diphosphate-sugar epimerase